jgi:cell division protein FtsN
MATVADLYIVAGVFKNTDNAERMRKKWKQRGMDAAIMITPTGMQYVVIDSGNDAALMDNREQELSTKYSESLWVWRK